MVWNILYHCYSCTQDIRRITLTNKISDNDLVKLIKLLYPTNCDRCNDTIYHDVKYKYYCLFNCCINDINIKINKQTTDDELIKEITLKFPKNCKKCTNIVCKTIKNNYYCLFYCNNFDYSNIYIYDKISDTNILHKIKSVYPTNCTKCNLILCNKIKLKYYCLFNCSTNEDKIIITDKISDNVLLNNIQLTYPNNCEKCNDILYKKIKQKYYCRFNCINTVPELNIINKIPDYEIIKKIKYFYPNNCIKCCNKICNQIKQNNYCLFYCKNEITLVDYDFVKNTNDINIDKLTKYIDDITEISCKKCKKYFMKQLKGIYYEFIANKKFNDINFLNSVLKIYGYSEETTHENAINQIKKNIFINVYDLLDGKYDKRHKTIEDLADYTMENNLKFPIKKAHSIHFKEYLFYLRQHMYQYIIA